MEAQGVLCFPIMPGFEEMPCLGMLFAVTLAEGPAMVVMPLQIRLRVTCSLWAVCFPTHELVPKRLSKSFLPALEMEPGISSLCILSWEQIPFTTLGLASETWKCTEQNIRFGTYSEPSKVVILTDGVRWHHNSDSVFFPYCLECYNVLVNCNICIILSFW